MATPGHDVAGGRSRPGADRLPVTLLDVLDAAERLEGTLRRTPVFRWRLLEACTGAAVCLLKLENRQRTGSFKLRGALNALLGIDPLQRANGVVAFSSGNHGQAVARAAKILGAPATIVLPDDAEPAKRAAVSAYGADIVTYQRGVEEREAVAEAVVAERGGMLIPPFDHPRVIAGQGTATLELLGQAGDALDLVVVPVGGGGLAAGAAVVAASRPHGPRVVGVEPEGADDTRRSLEAGRRVRIDDPKSIADGLLPECPGELTFEINRRLLEAVVTVSDAEIAAATLALWQRAKLVVEPSGAAGVAAAAFGALDVSGKRVGIVISGGNVSPERAAMLASVAETTRWPGR